MCYVKHIVTGTILRFPCKVSVDAELNNDFASKMNMHMCGEISMLLQLVFWSILTIYRQSVQTQIPSCFSRMPPIHLYSQDAHDCGTHTFSCEGLGPTCIQECTASTSICMGYYERHCMADTLTWIYWYRMQFRDQPRALSSGY